MIDFRMNVHVKYYIIVEPEMKSVSIDPFRFEGFLLLTNLIY